MKPASFGVRFYVVKTVLSAFYGEVEAPTTVHTGLPEIQRLVILFGPQRRMIEVFEKKPDLLVESFPHLRRRGSLRAQKPLRIPDGHDRGDLRDFFFERRFAVST